MRIFSVDFRRSINDLFGATPTLGSTATVANDSKGMALKCKSLATDYITYGDIAAINNIGTGAFSFVVALNLKSFLNHSDAINVLSGKGNSSTTGFSIGVTSATSLSAYILNSTITETIVPNRNRILILTRTAAGLCTLYDAGISVGTPVTNTGTVSSANLMAIGYDGSSTNRTPNASNYFSEVYNHCLTQQEIDNLVMDFNARQIVSKPIRGFTTAKPTDLSQLKGTGPTQGILGAYNALTKGVVVDISGNLKNGTPTNCISTKDGILLSGVNSKVVFGNIGAVKSVSFRFKPLSATCKIMEKAANSGLIYNNSGTLVAADFANIYVNGAVGTTLTTNQWHNVCLTSATNVDFSACTLGLNNTTYGAFEIEDLRFWTKTLSVQESKDYHNAFAKRIVLVEDFSDASADGITF